MASYLEAAMERFEVVTFKTASQLDLASLRDHKSMLLSKGKVYSATGMIIIIITIMFIQGIHQALKKVSLGSLLLKC